MKRRVPIVAIRDSVIFPRTDTLLSFGRPKSISAVNAAFQEDKVIAVFTQIDPRLADPGQKDLYPVGTIATITQMMSTGGEVHALVRGQARIRLQEIIAAKPHLVGVVEELSEEVEDSPEIKVMCRKLQELFKRAINVGKQGEIVTVMRLVAGSPDPLELVDQVASLLDVSVSEKQKILEEINLKKRLLVVLGKLSAEVNSLEIERTIAIKTQKRFEDQMKKQVLWEKKRSIEEELGEIAGEGEMAPEEIKEYKAKIKKAGMSPEVRAKAEKELKRLSDMSPHNPEGAYLRNYLDWLVEMPWNKTSPNNVPMKKAAQILEKEHYGIEKAKERILEFLAVMKLKKKTKRQANKDETQPTILCFIGPPGVGKTSIGRSIARALNRKFVRVSLGGIRDEAEIRGHRRTYVGALPGRIIQGIKNAGTKNPVFMLDEIDKIGADFRGDPSSALLEALDPEQNKEFSDHYLEVPFDLSEVMFIATGNVIETIPAALRDRMEIITFPGYTETEKFHIAKKFLLPKQFKAHGIDKKVSITDSAIREIITGYTREAGVRELERNIAAVCRKVARLMAENLSSNHRPVRRSKQRRNIPKVLEVKHIRKFLGPRKFTSMIAEKKDEVGMATGLSVTPFGGEILFIEVSLMPGKGKILLTGHLGEVMKESAQAAYTWVRSHYHILGLQRNFFEKIDIHVHVPEGAVKKDGPSAGVAIATALTSALTGIPVRRDVGMTGEITLRGRVLEIGGVKEKVIAGHRAGLTTIILPKENKKDLEDVPLEVRRDIKFVFVEAIEEVLRVALSSWPTKEVRKRREDSFVPIFSQIAAD